MIAAAGVGHKAKLPVMIQAMTDLEAPPLASPIAARQAKSFMCALLGCDPDAIETIVRAAKPKPEEFLLAR